MRSAWRWHRKSLITLEEAVFKGRRLCQKCGEKFLRQKFGTPTPPLEVATNGNDLHPQEAAPPPEETGIPTGANVGSSEQDYLVG